MKANHLKDINFSYYYNIFDFLKIKSNDYISKIIDEEVNVSCINIELTYS